MVRTFLRDDTYQPLTHEDIDDELDLLKGYHGQANPDGDGRMSLTELFIRFLSAAHNQADEEAASTP